MRFQSWVEQPVSDVRGSREVEYHMKDRHGQTTLAVIGKERSPRHMVYTVQDEFLSLTGIDRKSLAGFKWRSRREVVDWLSSLSSSSPESGSPNSSGLNSLMGEHEDDNGDQSRDPSSITWIGSSWTCVKRFRHYASFKRNGITISVKDFVFVMAEKERHIAYVEDMYEDRKLRKKLRVRWFHKKNELSKIPSPAPHPREVFFTQFPQVLSVECVDGLAAVLAPEHFDKCSSVVTPDAMELVHLCYRQFDNDGVRPLNIANVEGYWQQKALAVIGALAPQELSPNDDLSEDIEDEDTETGNFVRRGRRSARYKRRRTSSDSGQENSSGNSDVELASVSRKIEEEQGMIFEVGNKVERLCKDSGVRGCWFTGTVTAINQSSRRLLITYDDLLDEDNTNLEEWASTSEIAGSDKLSIHASQRSRVRPYPATLSSVPFVCELGFAVDVWWYDGWWEGVVLGRAADQVVVHFPDVGDTEKFQATDLRPSRDWVDGQWQDVKQNPDAFAALLEQKEAALASEDKAVEEEDEDFVEADCKAAATEAEKQAKQETGDQQEQEQEQEQQQLDDNDETDVLRSSSSELRWRSGKKRYRYGDCSIDEDASASADDKSCDDSTPRCGNKAIFVGSIPSLVMSR